MFIEDKLVGIIGSRAQNVFPVGIANAAVFNGGKLTFTPSSAGARTKFTFHTKIKLVKNYSDPQYIFQAGTASNNEFFMSIYPNGSAIIGYYNGSYVVSMSVADGTFKDYTGWGALTLSVDMTLSTEQIKLWWGVRQIESGGSVDATAGTQLPVGNIVTHCIGGRSYDSNYLSPSYFADTHFIEGQALDYSSFLELSDLVSGLYVAKTTSLTYGGNGARLDFADDSNMGNDISGNGNDWATSGTIDQTSNTPTDDFPTLNPEHLYRSAPSLTLGGLYYTCSSPDERAAFGTRRLPGYGKWYWEVTLKAYGVGDGPYIGLSDNGQTGNWVVLRCASTSTNLYCEGNSTHTSISPSNPQTTVAVDNVIGIAVDVDSGTVEFYVDGTLLCSCDLPETTAPILPFVDYRGEVEFNFGATGFDQTPPTDHLALSALNLTDPAVLKSSTVADIVLREGTGSTTIVSGLSFVPDLVNIKCRDFAYNWCLSDTERGDENELYTNLTHEVYTTTGGLSFTSEGYDIGSYIAVNDLNKNFADLCLKAGVAQGFEIQPFVLGDIINHGLGRMPSCILFKSLNEDNHWFMWHKDLGNDSYLLVNLQNAVGALASWCVPTSTQITVSSGIGTAGKNYIAYIFTDSEVFKAWSMTGNLSSDGPFVNLGGRPLWIMGKNAATTNYWFQYDRARNSHNPIDKELNPNVPSEEGTRKVAHFTSQGFKNTSTWAGFNGSGNLIVGLAIIESTKYSNAF